jgi:pilus assembly protein CpaB
MRPKSLILLLLALGCGLVASIGISQVLDRRNHDNEPAVEKEPIFVATKDIKVNEPLVTDKNVKLEDWPKDRIPSDAIRDPKDYLNQRAGGTILAGEPVRKAKFAIDNRIAEIPKGYRVEAVQSDAVSATGNLLQPGDRVDVLLTVKNAGTTSHQFAKTILQDVRVFAVNEQWRPFEGKKDDESISAKTVSLLLTPAQAQVIYLAEAMGRIRLVLRNPDDNEVSSTAGTDAEAILQGNLAGDRNKEFGEGAADKSDDGNSILKWLSNQKTATPATTAAAPAPAPDPTESFTMDVYNGGELHRVELFRKDRDSRWFSNADGSSGSAGSFKAPAEAASVPALPAPKMPDKVPPTSEF